MEIFPQVGMNIFFWNHHLDQKNTLNWACFMSFCHGEDLLKDSEDQIHSRSGIQDVKKLTATIHWNIVHYYMILHDM